MDYVSFAMSTDDDANSTVGAVSVGMRLEVEFYVADTDKWVQTLNSASTDILNISTIGTLLQWTGTKCCINLNYVTVLLLLKKIIKKRW